MLLKANDERGTDTLARSDVSEKLARRASKKLSEPSSTNGDVQSAAATAVSDANKELISEMADPRRGDIVPGESDGAGGEDGRAQAQRILARNSELVNGTVKAGPAGESETGVGHMVNSDRSHVGDGYSTD